MRTIDHGRRRRPRRGDRRDRRTRSSRGSAGDRRARSVRSIVRSDAPGQASRPRDPDGRPDRRREIVDVAYRAARPRSHDRRLHRWLRVGTTPGPSIRAASSRTTFETDAAWAGQLRPGSDRLLADPLDRARARGPGPGRRSGREACAPNLTPVDGFGRYAGAMSSHRRPRRSRFEPLTPDRIADLATLFDAGGDPKWCWCAYFRFRGRDWSNSRRRGTARPSRRSRTRRAGAGSGRLRRRRRGRLGQPRAARGLRAAGLFEVLGPGRRHAGLVDRLLRRRAPARGRASRTRCSGRHRARADHGATMLEAYPVDTAGERIASANAYKGTLSMFERAGFEVVARRQATADRLRDRSSASPSERREWTRLRHLSRCRPSSSVRVDTRSARRA